MIRVMSGRLACAAVAAFGLLAGCSNSNETSVTSVLRQLPQIITRAGQPDAEPQELTGVAIAQVLAGTTDPISFVSVDSTGAQVFVLQIETNGPYATYATASRQAVVFRDGLVTATRGLGGDLMSSETDALLPLITGGRTGTAPYTMRFLTPENVTESIDFTCLVTPGGRVPFPPALAALDQLPTVTADCNTSGLRITNVFALGPDGGIQAARQWLGPTQGYSTSVALR